MKPVLLSCESPLTEVNVTMLKRIFCTKIGKVARELRKSGTLRFVLSTKNYMPKGGQTADVEVEGICNTMEREEKCTKLQ